MALACAARPPSVNGSGKHDAAFAAALQAAYASAGSPRLHGLLSGVVCWFVRGYRPANEPDADNISKAVWDELGRLGLYEDDKQVRLRVAGIFDVAPQASGPVAAELDLRALPPDVIASVESLASDKGARHLTVVRVSRFETRLLHSCFA